jgi:hypothetical protein
VILLDTDPLVASAIRDDADYPACTDLLAGLHLAGRRMLVPGTVVAQVGYLMARTAAPRSKPAS